MIPSGSAKMMIARSHLPSRSASTREKNIDALGVAI
jgi:hypothetical protein